MVLCSEDQPPGDSRLWKDPDNIVGMHPAGSASQYMAESRSQLGPSPLQPDTITSSASDTIIKKGAFLLRSADAHFTTLLNLRLVWMAL